MASTILPLAVLATVSPAIARAQPTLVFSTFLGGRHTEFLEGVTFDAAGSIYAVGTVGFDPVSPPPSAGDSDALVAKYGGDGTLLWSITFGGTGGDRARGVALTADGRLCVVGYSGGADIAPVARRFGPGGGDGDGFVAFVTADGTVDSVVYLGGSGYDEIAGVAIGEDGRIMVVGYTYSSDFPTVSAFRPLLGGSNDAFVAVLSPDGASLVSSSFIGGSLPDSAAGVATDGSGAIWIVGLTESGDFPLERPLFTRERCGGGSGYEGFVAKLGPGGGTLLFSTYLCGSGADWPRAVAVDGEGIAYVGGGTMSSDFPTTAGAFQTSLASPFKSDGFVTAITPGGDRLVFSTFLGGSDGGGSLGGFGEEEVTGVAVDDDGRIFVAGATSSPDFPLAAPWQGALGGDPVPGRVDAFVSVLDGSGSTLIFSTFLGGSARDAACAAATDGSSRFVAVGQTGSVNFPTFEASQPTHSGGASDAWVAGLALLSAPLTVGAGAEPSSGTAPLAVSLTSSPAGGAPPYAFSWDFGDGSPHSTVQNPTHTYAAGGSYTARVTVTDSAAATASAMVTITVQANCYLSCTASAPLAASVLATSGLAPVPFSASASVSPDCPSSPTFAWTFGDGQTSTEEDPSHVYPAPGAYDWTMTASVAGRNCTKQGTVVVTSLGDVETLRIVPAVAHNDGFLGSKWRTDLALVNAASQPAGLSLVFFGSDGPIVRTASLAGGASREWHDLLVSLFGLADDAVARGTVQLAADAPVALAARTYNLSPSGTYGQTFPALVEGEGVVSGQAGLIAGLKKTTAFRTNLGVVNTSTQESTVRVALHDASGAPLGSPLTVTVPAGRWIQIDDVFPASGAPPTELASATVEVLTPATSAWAYAAVIDNATGDPTTVPVTVP